MELVEQSENITELAGAMIAAAREVSNPKKNAANPHFKSRYADLAATIEAFRPTFLEHGLVVTQLVAGSHLVTTVMHESGQWMRSSALIAADKPTIQAFGSALTYMRRYTLQALAGIAAEDDDGNGAMKSAKATPVAETGSW